MWGYVESDFRRDYGIRLVDSLSCMSWREFMVLVNGLSPFGALASHYKEALKAQREEEARNSDEPPPEVNSFWNQIASVTPRIN